MGRAKHSQERVGRESGRGARSGRHATQLTSNLNEVIIKKVFLFAVGVAQDGEGPASFQLQMKKQVIRLITSLCN